jgi:serine/threonine protein kinase
MSSMSSSSVHGLRPSTATPESDPIDAMGLPRALEQNPGTDLRRGEVLANGNRIVFDRGWSSTSESNSDFWIMVDAPSLSAAAKIASSHTTNSREYVLKMFCECAESALCFERSIYEVVDVNVGANIPFFVPLIKTYRNLTIGDLFMLANSGTVRVDRDNIIRNLVHLSMKRRKGITPRLAPVTDAPIILTKSDSKYDTERSLTERSVLDGSTRFGAILTLRVAESRSLEDLLPTNQKSGPKHKEFTAYHFLSIMLQVFFGLCTLHDNGVAHNDLHSKNILVEDVTNPCIIRYHWECASTADSIDISTNSRFVAKIFDYDCADVYGGVHVKSGAAQNPRYTSGHSSRTKSEFITSTGAKRRCVVDPEFDIDKWRKLLVTALRKYKAPVELNEQLELLGSKCNNRASIASRLKKMLAMTHVPLSRTSTRGGPCYDLYCEDRDYEKPLLEFHASVHQHKKNAKLRSGREKNGPALPRVYHHVYNVPPEHKPRGYSCSSDLSVFRGRNPSYTPLRRLYADPLLCMVHRPNESSNHSDSDEERRASDAYSYIVNKRHKLAVPLPSTTHANTESEYSRREAGSGRSGPSQVAPPAATTSSSENMGAQTGSSEKVSCLVAHNGPYTRIAGDRQY